MERFLKYTFIWLICLKTAYCINEENCVNWTYKEHPTNCKAFFYCWKEKWELNYCPRSYYFNITARSCVFGKCDDNVEPPLIGCINGKYKEDPSNCSAFYLCKKEKWELAFCPRNYYFNVTAGMCLFGKCNNSLPGTESCVNWTYKEHPINCTAFFYCWKEKWELNYCPRSYYFNITARSCVFGKCDDNVEPPLIGCINGKYKEDPSNCTAFYLCKKEKWELAFCPRNYYFNATAGMCLFGKCNNSLPGTESCVNWTYKEHPTNCTAFFYCWKEKWELDYCPRSYYFNITATSCVFGKCDSIKEAAKKQNSN